MFRSFRLKIVFWYVIIVLTTLLLFRLVSMTVIRHSLAEDLDQSLRLEAGWVHSLLDSAQAQTGSQEHLWGEITFRSRVNPRKEYIDIYDGQGNSLFRSPNLVDDSLRPFPPRQMQEPATVATSRGLLLRVLESRDPSHHIFVAYSLADIEAAHKEILGSFFFLIPAALLLVAGGGLFLASRFMRPIRDLHRYSEQLLQMPLDHDAPPMPVRSKDEMGKLIENVNTIVQRMRQSVRQSLSFSSLASHELRTPLAVLRTQMENILSSKASRETVARTAASVYDEILRLHHVVDDLLSLSTMQAGTLRLRQERFALRALLEEFCSEARLLATEKNVAVDLTAGKELFIQADQTRLRQMLFNLFDNALKHTPAGGLIRLSYEAEGTKVVLNFADTGCGIQPSELAQIFDFFYKGSIEADKGHGAGLGLALVRWIVQMHNGTISVQSEVGKGTTFIIRLPMTEPARTPA